MISNPKLINDCNLACDKGNGYNTKINCWLKSEMKNARYQAGTNTNYIKYLNGLLQVPEEPTSPIKTTICGILIIIFI